MGEKSGGNHGMWTTNTAANVSLAPLKCDLLIGYLAHILSFLNSLIEGISLGVQFGGGGSNIVSITLN